MSRQPTVLVVDDQEEIRDLLKSSLEFDGYQVFTAEGGQAAIRLYQEKLPDIVFLDIVMPDLNGLECLAHIRRIEPNHQSVVIMLTGYGDLETAREAMTLGAYDYITKPFNFKFISALLDEVLKESDEKTDLCSYHPH